MSRRELDQTLQFIQSMDRARNPEEICRFLLETGRRFGAEFVLAGTIPLPGTTRNQQLSHIVLDHWPIEWTRRYFSHGYIFRDPAIRGVTNSLQPFAWTELSPLYRDDPTSWRIMEEAGDHRLKNGFTVPLVTLEGDVAGFSLAGERLELSPRDRGMLTLMATYALGRSLFLQERSPISAAHLTPRERETLQWAAEGKSEWEIGECMGISKHGVDRHMRSARSKLRATSRTHAVAEAMRQHLIN